MKRISVFFALLSMSLLMAMGQININGIEYEIYSYLKEINGKKIKTEVALIKSASTTLSGSVTIPSQISYKGKMYDVMTISRNAFNDCSSITSINIASGIQYIGEYAFKNCTGLTSFKKPGTLSKLGDGAFYNCCNLVSIELPEINAYESLIELHSELFYGCSNLVYVKIPSTVRIIGEDVFYKCTSLTDIFCYSTKVPRIRYNSFDGTNPKNIKIHVPKEALADYQSSIWNQFKIIDANMTRPQVQKPVIKQNVNSNTREAIDMGGSIEWANMNLESKSIQDPGGIFAWGETTSKSEFTRSNYTEPKVPGKFEYEKYNNGLRGTNYDAARVKWGDGWRLPSKNEFKELIGKCEQIRHKGYVEFIAPNGNRLIFPLLEWTNITYNGIDNFYWTLDLDEYGPICCTFSKGSYDISGSGAISTSYERKRTSFCKVEPISGHYGGFIRPVRNKGKRVTNDGNYRKDLNNNGIAETTKEEILVMPTYNELTLTGKDISVDEQTRNDILNALKAAIKRVSNAQSNSNKEEALGLYYEAWDVFNNLYYAHETTGLIDKNGIVKCKRFIKNEVQKMNGDVKRLIR